jgi:rod shape-determining protein MreD
MKYIALILITYIALVLQAGLSSRMALGPISPNFLALVVVMAVFTHNGWKALLGAAIAGFLSDCLAPQGLGIGMLCATLVALTMQPRMRHRFGNSAIVLTLLSFLIVLTISLASTTCRMLLAGVAVDAGPQSLIAAGTAAYSALLGLCGLTCWRLVKRTLPSISPSRSTLTPDNWNLLTR